MTGTECRSFGMGRTVTIMCDTCGDNRFELIEKYKQKLLDATNIGDSPEEMAVIDNILFRFWQMGWLNLATDTISRATAIETVRKAKSIGQAHRMLVQLPSAQRWVPCSERMPKVREWVLCQCRAGIMDVLRLTDNNGWYKDSTHIYMHSFVLAWMPLPEPWKGEKE